MARVERKGSGRCAPEQRDRIARIRSRWHHASLKTSFMGYIVVFLAAALILSTTTASFFGNLQNQVADDFYEYTGLYLYDDRSERLIPARLIEISEDGSGAFVQTVRENVSSIAPSELPSSTNITDASDYLLSELSASEQENGAFEISSGSMGSSQPGKLDLSTLPAYNAWAQQQFENWLAAHPESPYATFFSGDDSSDSSAVDDATSGLITSAVGYYLSTPPSDGALILSGLFGMLAFLMFPLWFGLCIFAAARRFFRKRLEPGFTVLDEAASNIAHQDLDFTVAYDRDDELGRLASSFETMRSSLADSQRTLWRTAEERKRLNAAFAHDLRTPLTILKGKIELLDAHLQAGDASPERLAASVSSLATQVKRLERYVEAMSGLQKLEDRAIAAHEAAFDEVAGMVEDIGLTLAAQAGGDTAFALSVSSLCDRERPALCVDPALFGEVAENLIANAMRYAHARVDTRLDVEDDRMLVLIVEDDGPGFSSDALEHGCAPFFSEAPSSDHFGLGLNIASLLCQRHGGTLVLENRGTVDATDAAGARTIARFSLEHADVERG